MLLNHTGNHHGTVTQCVGMQCRMVVQHGDEYAGHRLGAVLLSEKVLEIKRQFLDALLTTILLRRSHLLHHDNVLSGAVAVHHFQ